jgi:hypothetical protein
MKRIEKKSISYEPFQIIKQDNIFFIAMPKNFDELISLEGFRELAALIESSRYKMILCEKEVKLVPSKDSAMFFKGLYNRVFKEEWSPGQDTFRPSSTKPAGRGRAAFDLYALKKASGIMNIENYLGESARSAGGNSHLTFYLSVLGGAQGTRVFGKVDQVIKDLMAKQYEKNKDPLELIAATFKIELSQCTREYKKTKQVKVKGRSNETKTVTITPAKISTTPYVFSKAEKENFEKQEACFAEIEKINSTYAGGVPISEFTNVQKEYSKNITACWNYCSKYSKLKSARLKAIKEILQLSKRQAEEFKISKNHITTMWSRFGGYVKECYRTKNEADLDTILYALSSSMVDTTINTKYLTSKNMVAKALSIRACTAPEELKSATELYEHLRNLTADVICNTSPNPPKLTQPRRVKKAKEIRHDEKFSDEESKNDAEDTSNRYGVLEDKVRGYWSE